MKYFKLTMQFIRQNFFKLALSALLPAICLSFCHNPALKFSTLLVLSEEMTFWQVMKGVSLIANWRKLLLFLPMIILFCVFMSSTVGAIERKMKYGEFYDSDNTLKFFLRKVNNNFVHVFKCVAFMVLSIEIVTVIEALLVYLWVKVMGPFSMVVMSVITAVVFGVVILMFITYTSLVLPNMTLRGYNLRQSVAASMRVFSPAVFGKVFVTFGLAFMVTIVPLIGHSIVVYFFHYSAYQLVNWVFSFGWYFIFCIFFPSYVYALFFEAEDLEREDIRRETFTY